MYFCKLSIYIYFMSTVKLSFIYYILSNLYKKKSCKVSKGKNTSDRDKQGIMHYLPDIIPSDWI